MRSLLTLLACLMLVVTAWGGTAQAADLGCGEMVGQVAAHLAADCDEVPADADKGYPHCHTTCHGHYVVEPVSARTPGEIVTIADAYAPGPVSTMTAYGTDQQLRPPQA